MPKDPNLLVGVDTVDDAAVYRIGKDFALVQSVDFFPPIVDNPYSFGAIAAANAMSDIYAMGGRPLIALNIVCFPMGLSTEVLVQILKGGADKAAEAGMLIVGGHTIDDKEPKYGLAVTGIVKPGEQVTNAAAKEGDVLVLTKPLGTGIITTAAKADQVGSDVVEKVVSLMSTLNKAAAEAMLKVGVDACTDITGFGLLGHLRGMTKASRVGARIYLSRVPVIPEVWKLAELGVVPGGSIRNLKALRKAIIWYEGMSESAKLVLFDAQTSGGLLIAVSPQKEKSLLSALRAAGIPDAAVIGDVIKDRAARIQVLP